MTTRRAAAEGTALGPFVTGLVGAAAVAALASGATVTTEGVVTVAIGMRIAAAVFAVAGAWLSALAGWLYSLQGLIAAVPDAVRFVGSNGFGGGTPPALRFVGVTLMAVLRTITAGARLVSVRRMPASAIGLALFGALQILIAASTFVADSGSSANLILMAVFVPGAAGLGWFVVHPSEIVVGFAEATLAKQSIYSAALDSACRGPNFNGVVLLIVYCGAYFATRAVTAPFTRQK